MKTLAIDYGKRFVGLAVSDNGLALPIEPLDIKDRDILPLLKVICDDYRVGLLVFGLPLSKERRPSGLSKEIRVLASKASRSLKVRVRFVDEALTSFEAQPKVWHLGKSKRRGAENSQAAVLILEEFLGRSKRREKASQTKDEEESF